MANNRLYIGCKECREYLFLSKHFGEPFYVSEQTRGELNEFFEKHAYCGSGWAITFELFDEMGDDGTYEYYMAERSRQ